MQQTEHYGLNLWELNDRIQMADFNADNQKLDAALAVLAAGGGGVEEITHGSNNSRPMFSIGRPLWPTGSDPRWEEFSLVILIASVTEPDTGGIPYGLLNTGNTSSGAFARFSFSPGGYIYVLTPFKDGTRMVEGFFIANGNCQVFTTDVPFNNLYSFYAGCQSASGVNTSALINNMRAIGIR